MIFGLDIFAKVEFATTKWHDFKNWIEICDHTNIEWGILSSELSEWTKQCSSPASTQWTIIDNQAGGWNDVPASDEDPWVKLDIPNNDITRC